MRIVSLVPSWTETLIACGANVVGRTRYCIYPKGQVEKIPVVGGTKQVDLERLVVLNPDLLVLDREENPKAFSELGVCKWFASHVTSAADVPRELGNLAALMEGEVNSATCLRKLEKRWRTLLELSPLHSYTSWEGLPGVRKWWRKPQKFGAEISPEHRFVYVIWKKPWMAAGPPTFIGSVFQHLGYGSAHFPHTEKYPEIRLEEFGPANTILLFSTEPFPFESAERELLSAFPHAMALIDGEGFSWFGLRSLQFLEKMGLEEIDLKTRR